MRVIVNGEPFDAAPDASVRALLDQIGAPEKGVAVELNLEIVPKSDHARRRLREGDRLEIVQFVGGG